MPFKNTSRFLPETIQSILDQSEESWELLAVDDHSNDDSFKVVEEFSKIDGRIKVLKNKGKGIIQALQTGFSVSTGELITRMDSDDLMPSEKLKTLKSNLLIHGRGHLATGLVKYFADEPLGDGFIKYEEWLNRLTREGRNFDDIFKECVIPSPCWMVYRDDFDNCGGFDSDIYPEDYDLAFRFYESGLKVIPSSDILHLWRDYPSRTSRTDDNYAYNSFIDFKLYHFLKQNRDPKRALILWGAGKKGKKIAELLLKAKLDFHWICDNPKKIGKHIYDKEMLHWREIDNHPKAQSIISVASPEAQIEIKAYFTEKGLKPMEDFFFFC